jgi:hypothetical protein
MVSSVSSTQEMSKLIKIIKNKPSHGMGLIRKPAGTMSSSAYESVRGLVNVHFPKCKINGVPTWQPRKDIARMECNPWINEQRVKQAITEFGPHKADGEDRLKPIVLQHLPPNAIIWICAIYTACMNTGYTPMSWRESRVIFIDKPGKTDKAHPRSFRPISLISFLFKTLERVVLFHLDEDCIKKKPLHNKQHAFR